MSSIRTYFVDSSLSSSTAAPLFEKNGLASMVLPRGRPEIEARRMRFELHQPVHKPKPQHIGAGARALSRGLRALPVRIAACADRLCAFEGALRTRALSVLPACGGMDALGAATDGRAAADPIPLAVALDSVGIAPGPPVSPAWPLSRCEYRLGILLFYIPGPAAADGDLRRAWVFGMLPPGERTLADAREAEGRRVLQRWCRVWGAESVLGCTPPRGQATTRRCRRPLLPPVFAQYQRPTRKRPIQLLTLTKWYQNDRAYRTARQI
ncbi:hypothetical protein B0H19DRAFT_1374977 [Mycena capillaripes]|nr:hypothetical protein B0H19DRAFT_1374977 [Mycena capillaripes]